MVWGAELEPEAPSPAASQALEVAIPTHMAPLHLQLGGIQRVYKCQVEGCSEGPSTSCATICAHMYRDHLQVRLVCPSFAKTFLNWMPLGITEKFTAPSKISICIVSLFLSPIEALDGLSLCSFYVKGCFLCLFICKTCRSARQPVFVTF